MQKQCVIHNLNQMSRNTIKMIEEALPVKNRSSALVATEKHYGWLGCSEKAESSQLTCIHCYGAAASAG